jgi:hypothetical protein
MQVILPFFMQKWTLNGKTRIKPTAILHVKTRMKNTEPDPARDPRFFDKSLGKKQLPPPVHKADRLAGGGLVCVCVVGLAGWAGWLAGWLAGW